jgi:uncharacterized membrane protein
MYLIAIAWFYVALLMALAEATSSQGSVLGAIITFILYGLLPISILVYVMGTGRRRMAKREAEQQASDQGDGGDHAPGEPRLPVGKEP